MKGTFNRWLLVTIGLMLLVMAIQMNVVWSFFDVPVAAWCFVLALEKDPQ